LNHSVVPVGATGVARDTQAVSRKYTSRRELFKLLARPMQRCKKKRSAYSGRAQVRGAQGAAASEMCTGRSEARHELPVSHVPLCVQRPTMKITYTCSWAGDCSCRMSSLVCSSRGCSSGRGRASELEVVTYQDSNEDHAHLSVGGRQYPLHSTRRVLQGNVCAEWLQTKKDVSLRGLLGRTLADAGGAQRNVQRVIAAKAEERVILRSAGSAQRELSLAPSPCRPIMKNTDMHLRAGACSRRKTSRGTTSG
jgi:hypothetical protein